MRGRREIAHQRDHVETLWAAHAETHNLERAALQETARTLGYRLDGITDLRRQVDRQAGTFVPRDTLDALLAGVTNHIDTVTAGMQVSVTRLEDSSRAATTRLSFYAVGFGLTSIVLAVALLLVIVSQVR